MQAFTPLRTKVDTNTALVVLDTNVLLAPYKTSATALNEIRRIYTQLRSEKRLVIPAQVAREFGRNRPNLVASLYKQVVDFRTLAINGRYEPPPVLQELPEHKKAREALDKMQEALKTFRSSLDALANTVAQWQHTDPVLDVYERLFDGSVVHELAIPAEEVEKMRKDRYEAKLPPGYKDKGKDDGGIGDLLIWLTLKQVARQRELDVLFVTEDAKEDWFHRAGDTPVFPRHELALEFAEHVYGRAFGQTNLSDFLRTFGAKEEVVAEVRENERDPFTQGARAVQRRILNHIASVATPDDHFARQVRVPHFSFSYASDNAVCGAIVVEDGYSSTELQTRINRAVLHGREMKVSEFVVVLAVDGEYVAHLSRFAEMLSFADSAILVHGWETGFVTFLNTAKHPTLRRAFEVNTSF
ncbi:hypothetical protein AKJ09_08977 [Labilithrix luteola]|uniref:PIN like domain-containing protein n=1 Tax=Labilithrix luteola TaxID=1391654 RepID=A0A0K1Q9A4_9BACT|nr:hypothetical protein AKJ09_08977 [Labilithrix luteola]